MKQFYFLLFTLIIFTVSAQNELSNGSFETWTGTASLDTPVNWYGSKSSIAKSAVLQSTDAYEGASSVVLTASGTGHKRFTNEAITATSESYTLTYFAKGDGDIRNAFHDGGYSAYADYTTLSSTEGWVKITYEFTPTAGDLEVVFSVRNTSGVGIFIDNVVLVKTATLSLESFKDELKLSLYPNPATNGFVNITSATSEAISVRVFDVLGKQVLNNTIANNRLNVSSLNAGMYILHITQNGNSVTKKLVIK
ncbi:T9SS type A sorting domain-containing protein [Bizionia myxarmorum]|uniref:T9SS type A sorting domain-containing protein n=1 Tax=Bizionia myxarmorum TaxID=291186 RepID=A0A5D0RDM1_9FLAO|nr:T9SS type A sorting domain-containing protein [Bizionia myxarmorum]TYB79021.1 T9SS type A sorting domain-containing protein [Bizionia myxarmorum]